MNLHMSTPWTFRRGPKPFAWMVTLLCGLSGWCPTVVIADDWVEFRGPQQNGTSSVRNLPVQWSETDNVRWFSKTVGLGWSSPVIARNRIYFTSAVNAEEIAADKGELKGRQSLNLICLDAENGKEIFSKTIFEQHKDSPRIHNKNSHASPTPVIDGDRIYVHFGHQGTACTNLDGKILWENREHAFPPTHGNGGSPIIANGNLVLTCDGGETPYTLALDLSTGREVWKTGRGVPADKSFSFATPQLIVHQGVSQIVSPGSNIVQSLSPVDGRVLWHVLYDGYSVIPRPVYDDGLVYVCTGYNVPKLLAIDPSGTGDVTESHVKWTFAVGVPNTPSILCIQNQVVMASDKGIATGLDSKTGREIWRKRLGGDFSASPLAVGDQVYFQSESGELTLLKIGEKPVEIAKNQLPGRIFASYSVVGNDFIVRSEKGIYRIGRP